MLRAVRTAELDAASAGAGQSFTGPPGDRLSLLLSDQGHDSDSEGVGLWHISGDERDSSLLQAEQEMRVAAQAVELGNQKCRASEASMLERLSQLGPIVALAGFHFGVGLQELRIGSLARNESCGGGVLRFESQGGRAPLCGG